VERPHEEEQHLHVLDDPNQDNEGIDPEMELAAINLANELRKKGEGQAQGQAPPALENAQAHSSQP